MRETKKNIAVLVILNLIIFGLYFYLFMNIKSSDRDISAELVQIKLGADKDERLRSVKSLMDETKNQREKIANLFIQQDGSVDFIEMMESLGKTAGVKLSIDSVGIDPAKNKTGSSTESFRLSVKAEGLWINVLHLLSLLENMPFKVSFDSISLNKISEPEIVNPAKGKREIASYWKGDFGFSVLKIKSQTQPLKN